MAARNPLWGGEESPSGSPQKKPITEKEPEAPVNESETDPEEEDYWFLKYEDNEGWEDPNPGQKK